MDFPLYGAEDVDLLDPISDDPLNHGLVLWHLGLPNLTGGQRSWDLCNRAHGTLTNGPTWGAGPNGFGALTFDGTDDYVSLGTTAALAITGDITASCWLRSTNAGGYYQIFGCYDTSSPFAGWSLAINPGVGAGIPGFWSNNIGSWVAASTAMNDDAWHMVTVTGGGSSGTFYLDGRSDGTFAYAAPSAFAGSKNLMARSDGTFNYGATVRAWQLHNRALSATEVAALYQQSLRGYPDTLRRLTRTSYLFLPQASVTGTLVSFGSDSVMMNGAEDLDLLDPIEKDHPLNARLASWWLPIPGQFGGRRLYDLCNRAHGDLTTTVGWSTAPNGFGSVVFDGSNYVDCGSDVLLGTGAWSIEFDCTLVSLTSGVLATLKFDNTTSLLFGYVHFGGSYQGWSLGDFSWVPKQDGRTAVAGQRYHIVYTFNGVGDSADANYQIYQNGVPGSVAASGVYGSTGGVNRIGYHAVASDFIGPIHSVRIYYRVLGPAEVVSLYDQSLRGYPDTLRRLSSTIYSLPPATTSYLLSAACGSFGLSGQSASLLAARQLTAAQASYSLSGQDVALKSSRLVTAGSGSVALSGQDASLKASRALGAEVGSVAVSGQDAALVKTRLLGADGASFVSSGQDASLKASRSLPSAAGSFALSGQDVTLDAERLLTGAAGSFALTGQDAVLRVARLIVASAGSFSFSGQDVALEAMRQLVSAAGTFSLSGQDVGLRVARQLVAAPGSFGLSGQDAALLALRIVTAGPGSFSLSGMDASMFKTRTFTSAAGSFTLSGQVASLLVSRLLGSGVGSFTLSGQVVTLTYVVTGIPSFSFVQVARTTEWPQVARGVRFVQPSRGTTFEP